MLLADNIEQRLFGTADVDRRRFLGGVSAGAILFGAKSAGANMLMTGIGTGSQSDGGSVSAMPVLGVTATPSLAFTQQNNSTYPNGVVVPGGSCNAPGSTGAWYAGCFFTIALADGSTNTTQTEYVLMAGLSISSGTRTYFSFNRATLRWTISIRNGSFIIIEANGAANAPLQRGVGYFISFGMTASGNAFFSLLDVFGNVIANQTAVPAYNVNAIAQIQYIGLGLTTNNVGFTGTVSNVYMAYGVVPNASGVPLTSGGSAYSNGTLDFGSVATGKLSMQDFVAGCQASGSWGTHTLRYFLPLAGPGGELVAANANVTSGSVIPVGVTTTASASLSSGTSFNVGSTTGVLPRASIWDVTSGAQIGTVQTVGSPTLYLNQSNVMNPVTSGDTLLIGRVPATIRAGQEIFNMTTLLRVGTVASWDAAANTITIVEANPVNPVTAADSLLIGGNVHATGAVSSGSSIPVAFVPKHIVVGQNIYNLTQSKAVGTVADWDTVGLTVRIKQASPTNAIASGDTLSFSGLNPDPASVASTAPSTWFTTTAPWCQPLLGDPIQPSPWLRLRQKADGTYYVWGFDPFASTGKVWFDGVYSSANGATPSFEGRLIRKDTRADLIAWTALSGVTTTPASGSTVSVAGGYTTMSAGVANANFTSGSTFSTYGSYMIPLIQSGQSIYNVTQGGLLVGTVSSFTSSGSITIVESNPVNSVNAGDVLTVGSQVTLVFSTALPCSLPPGAKVTVSGLTTSSNGVSVSALNGTWTILNATPSSISFFYTGSYLPQLQSIGPGSVAWSGYGLYSGYLSAAPGVGFTRSVRYAGQATTAVHACEKHAVGIVELWNAQSQVTVMFGDGGNNQLPTTDGDNAFAVRSGLSMGISDVGGFNANSDWWSANGCHAGYFGSDSITAHVNKTMAINSLPVMIMLVALAGHSQSDFYLDRTPVRATPHGGGGPSGGGDNWSPNGVKTLFTKANGNPIWIQPGTATSWPAGGHNDPFGNPYSSSTSWGLNITTGGAQVVPVVPGTFTGVIKDSGGTTLATFADDGLGILTGTGTFASGTIDYTGTTDGVGGGDWIPYLNLTFSSAPPTGATYQFDYTNAMSYTAATDANLKVAPADQFSSTGLVGMPHTGSVATAYCWLDKNSVTALVHMWWTANLSASGGWTGGGINPATSWTSSTFSNNYLLYDGIQWMHKQWPQAQNAMRFICPAGRENPGSPSTGASPIDSLGRYGSARFAAYSYVAHLKAGGDTKVALLADCYDVSLQGNGGGHQDWPGGMMQGERFAYAIASALGLAGAKNLYSGSNGQAPGAPVMGPVLKTATRTNSTTITLTYDLPNGTSLATHAGGGIGTNVYGFALGQSSSSLAAAWTARAAVALTGAITATITAVDTVTITTTGSWSTYVSLNYCESYPVFSGSSNKAADDTMLGSLLCDNAGGFSLPLPYMLANYTGGGVMPHGFPAMAITDWVV